MANLHLLSNKESLNTATAGEWTERTVQNISSGAICGKLVSPSMGNILVFAESETRYRFSRISLADRDKIPVTSVSNNSTVARYNLASGHGLVNNNIVLAYGFDTDAYNTVGTVASKQTTSIDINNITYDVNDTGNLILLTAAEYVSDNSLIIPEEIEFPIPIPLGLRTDPGDGIIITFKQRTSIASKSLYMVEC